MRRYILDAVVALLLFAFGIYWAFTWYTVSKMFSLPWWEGTPDLVAATACVAAIGLFFWRRPSAIVGACSMLYFASAVFWGPWNITQVFWDAVPVLVAGLVFWRFMRRSRGEPAAV